MAKKKLEPTRFMPEGSHYDKKQAHYIVTFIECLCHTKGKWVGNIKADKIKSTEKNQWCNSTYHGN